MIVVQSQPGQIVHYLENTHHKNRAGGVAQGVGSEFKLQNRKIKKERNHQMA
jgi:hypothetical protein